MAVDRGGLSYQIKVVDAFSTTIKDFKKKIASAKSAFADLKAASKAQKDSAESFKKSTKAVDENAEAIKRLKNESNRQRAVEREAVKLRNAATRDSRSTSKQRAAEEKAAAAQRFAALGAEQRALTRFAENQARAESEAAKLKKAHRLEDAKNLRDQQQALKGFADAQTRREKEAAKIIASKRKDEQAVRQADPAFQAQKRINQGLQEERVARSQINLLRQRAAQQFKQGDILGGSRTLKQARDLKEQLRSIDKTGNSLFFTFRRLVGVLAVFTIARSLVQGFQDLIKSGLEFNNTIDQARIGIAGLVVSSAQIRDQFGQNLTGAEAFSSAMAAADDQVKKLQKDAIKLGVSFQTLVETFQIAVAPGFGAGLNLDQIRKLTGSIAAAAKAIGLPQNQLAEEIRSLLSGTIQARTTRIATALGITNEDIKRLKQTGQLFDVLEKRFQAFNDAAERQARTTLSGVREVIGGLIQQILGQAAQPLFKELIDLGNDLIDNVLRIKSATGEITLNPDLVESFQSIFDALKDGLLEVKRIAKDLGFESLQSVFTSAGAALGAGIQFAIGFAETFLGVINRIVKVVRFVADTFGLTTKELGKMLGAIGSVVALTLVWNNTLGLIGLSFRNILGVLTGLIPQLATFRASLEASGTAATGLGAKIRAIAFGPVGILIAALGVVLLGFNKLVKAVFDIDLNFRETIQALAVSLFAGFAAIGFGIQELVIDFGIKVDGFLNETIQGIVNLSTRAKKKLAELRGDTLAAGELQAELDQTISDQDTANDKKRQQQETKLNDLKTQNLAKIKGLQEEIAKIIGDAASRGAQGEGFDPKALERSFASATGEAQDFTGILSVIERQMQVLDALMQDVDKDTLSAGAAFRAAFEAPDLEGIGKDIQDIFSGRDIKLATDLNKIRDTALDVETKIAEIQSQQQISAKRRSLLELAASGQLTKRQVEILSISKAEGLIVSLLQDKKIIAEDLATIEQKTLDLARAEAATKAISGTRELVKEAVLLRQSLAIGQQITAADAARLDIRKRAVLEAQFALDTEKTAQDQAQAAAERTITALEEQQRLIESGPQTPDSRTQIAASQGLIDALREQLDLQQDISAERLKQLELAKTEAELVANGSITQGLSRGFEDVVKDLPTAFEAGVTIVKQSVTALADFISSSIVQAFDPTDDTSLQEKFARFLQGIAQLILQQLTQLGIAAAINALTEQASAATIEQSSATIAADIRTTGAFLAGQTEIEAATIAAGIRAGSGGFGLHAGGLVPAYHEGGHIARGRRTATKAHAIAEGYARGGRNRHPLDTVPAWLQPGEFVIPKSIVDDLGLGFFEAVRKGHFPIAAAAPPSGAHAAIPGMARGGLVSDQAQRQSVGASSKNGDVQILPTLVAGEKELDRLHAGGRSAFMKTIRDNAPTIRGILQGGR